MTVTEPAVTIDQVRIDILPSGNEDVICDVSFNGTRGRVEVYVRNGYYRSSTLRKDIRNQFEPVIGRMADDEVDAIEHAIALVAPGEVR